MMEGMSTFAMGPVRPEATEYLGRLATRVRQLGWTETPEDLFGEPADLAMQKGEGRLFAWIRPTFGDLAGRIEIRNGWTSGGELRLKRGRWKLNLGGLDVIDATETPDPVIELFAQDE